MKQWRDDNGQDISVEEEQKDLFNNVHSHIVQVGKNLEEAQMPIWSNVYE